MKMLSILILLSFALLFSACQEENSIVSPDMDLTQNSLSKAESQSSIEPAYCITPTLTKVSKTLTFSGTTGGTVFFSYTFSDKSAVEATLTLDKGSFYGTKTFTITFDELSKTVDLNPHGTIFIIPAHLTLRFKYLNRLDPIFSIYSKDPCFYYIPDNGTAPIKITYDRVVREINSGSLFVFNARLPHFSRFGFCR
jgi:hypothetical protein